MTASDGARERRHAWVTAVEGGDVDDYAAIVTEDVVWFPPVGDPLQGRAAFRRWLEPFMGAFRYNLRLSPATSREGGGWAYETGAFRSIMEPLDGGATQEHKGNYFVLWRYGNDDVWRIERYVDLDERAVVEIRRA
ncbi:MAG: YybH family protein [Vicinamibacteraceae bacterium]